MHPVVGEGGAELFPPFRYVVITPVRDEERFIEPTIKCVVRQTIKPLEWIVVNDGSRDRTGEIVDSYSKQFDWIKVVHLSDRGCRYPGGGVVEAFYAGYKKLTASDWEFLVKLDGDITFDDDYFEACLTRMSTTPRLGIAGGTLYHVVNGKKVIEHCPRFHVRGASKIYRRGCWDQIGGLWPAAGWDAIDEVKAQMLGWDTGTFNALHIVHHRFTGSAEGLWRGMIKDGRADHIAGYHPVFMAAKLVYRLFKQPYIVGSLGILYGYLSSKIAKVPQVDDPALIRYLRNQQLRRLCGMNTIWK